MRLTAVLLVFAGVLAAQQGSPDIVISQAYGGGGNAGAQWRSDFIELFNRGRAPVDITGWSVQYGSAMGTTWQVTPLQGTVAPGRYYLVQEADGANAAATALPTADATGTIPMSGTAAKVALVRNSTALDGARPTGSAIVDFVGYGDTNGFEGSAPGRVLSNTTAAIRRGGGCTDTDDNANDFQTGIPAPRNSATASVDCAAIPSARNATISQIQGSGATSPLAGQAVITRGVVTGVGTNGFWIQSLPGDDDNDPATSEGVFVFTSTRPAATISRGSLVQVTASVSEFRPSTDPDSPTLTELVDPAIDVQGQGIGLPNPVKLLSGTNWERYEGMRVSVDELRTTGGTLGSINEATGISTSTGVFFGVLPGNPTPYRTPNDNEVFEAVRVDTRAQGGTVLDVTAGATVTGLVGPLDHGFRTYTVVQDPTPSAQVNGGLTARPLFAKNSAQITVVAANLQRFFDEQDDASTSDPVVATAAVQARIQRTARIFRDVLGSPDVIAVEEVENEPLLKRLAAATGEYDAYLFEGNDIGGIDVGIMVKRGLMRVISVTQEGKDAGPPNDRLWDRTPLVARLEAGGNFTFTAIVVHLRSLINADTATVAAKRRAQAEALRDLIAARAALGEEVVVLGDLNMFQFDPLMSVIRSKEPVSNLTDTLTLGDSYSYVENGVRQTLDHMLVTEGLKARLYRYEIAHINSEFPDVARNDATGFARVSDHDFPIGTFQIEPGSVQITPAGVTNAANFLTTPLVPGEIVTVFGQGLAGGQVLISGAPVQVISRTSSQVSALIPSGLAGTTASVQVASSNIVQVPVAPAAPGVFGVLNQDYTLNTAANAATRGSVVQIFGTGGGKTVRIGGQTSQVLYAGDAPGFPGLVQINAVVPAGVASGNALLVVSDGARSSDLKTFVAVR